MEKALGIQWISITFGIDVVATGQLLFLPGIRPREFRS
jgi:hypothetical protein